ncbi:hypothetical protein AAMO2058_000874600 [Amorphochlora amoebiformis]
MAVVLLAALLPQGTPSRPPPSLPRIKNTIFRTSLLSRGISRLNFCGKRLWWGGRQRYRSFGVSSEENNDGLVRVLKERMLSYLEEETTLYTLETRMRNRLSRLQAKDEDMIQSARNLIAEGKRDSARVVLQGQIVTERAIHKIDRRLKVIQQLRIKLLEASEICKVELEIVNTSGTSHTAISPSITNSSVSDENAFLLVGEDGGDMRVNNTNLTSEDGITNLTEIIPQTNKVTHADQTDGLESWQETFGP